MERKTPFLVGETYHAYTRGVEKRIAFEEEKDYQRMQILFYLCNSKESVDMRNLFKKYKGEPFVKIFEEERGETLVDIIAYALIPNHLHLLLKEKIEGGISRFMLKLMTAYSMYFNIKHERSGPLFTRPFRSRHVDSDEYLRWLFSYILLNPLDIHQKNWKEQGLKNKRAAKTFLREYPYGNFCDLARERPESGILSTGDFDLDIMKDFDDLLGTYVEEINTKGNPW